MWACPPSTVAFICLLPGAELCLVAVAPHGGIYLGTAVAGGKLIPKGKPAWRAMLQAASEVGSAQMQTKQPVWTGVSFWGPPKPRGKELQRGPPNPCGGELLQEAPISSFMGMLLERVICQHPSEQ